MSKGSTVSSVVALDFVPLGDRVVIQRDAEKDKIGSFYLADTAQEKPMRGTVLAAGGEALKVKVGNTVLFSKYSGIDTEVDGLDVVIMKEEEILGIFK